MLVGLSLVAIGVIGLIIQSQNEQDQVVTASAPTASAPPLTPHQVCALQVFAIADHLSTAGGNQFGAEYRINGENDPFVEAGRQVVNQFNADEADVGTTQAVKNARANASDQCTNVLRDKIRPNYPTDGTYPGQ